MPHEIINFSLECIFCVQFLSAIEVGSCVQQQVNTRGTAETDRQTDGQTDRQTTAFKDTTENNVYWQINAWLVHIRN